MKVHDMSWLNEIKDIVLEDDETPYGGTSFVGETVWDFLLSSNLGDDEILTLDDLNRELKSNGIKEISIVVSQDIHEMITRVLERAIGYQYAMHIGEDEEFSKAVLDDIHASSAWKTDRYFNDDDVRVAIGRVLLYRLGIWY